MLRYVLMFSSIFCTFAFSGTLDYECTTREGELIQLHWDNNEIVHSTLTYFDPIGNELKFSYSEMKNLSNEYFALSVLVDLEGLNTSFSFEKEFTFCEGFHPRDRFGMPLVLPSSCFQPRESTGKMTVISTDRQGGTMEEKTMTCQATWNR
ncbi:MAG: hypothetical protein KC505_00185 [Myxococcales bacterium]|nr:hypothetical protein [Myxococcales bacterium]USN51177.1 MAG: hypothetical protein H6731_01850 [Myxococcales bacterium]